MVKRAFLFPGQGAQFVGMGEDFFKEHESARNLFQKADSLLKFSLSELCFHGPEEELTRTANSQPAIFVMSLAVFEVLKNQYPHIQAQTMAGLSLGEYSALVAAGAMSFEEGLLLVRKRGELMDEAARQNPGTMASIIGLELEMCKQVCKESGAELANLNAPDQTVLSGTKSAIEKAMQVAKDKGAKRAIELKVSGAFHSTLMQPAQKGLQEALKQVSITAPKVKVIANVSADFVSGTDQIKTSLAQQVTSPVRWVETVQRLHQEGITQCLEVGPGKVLKGLVKRIQPEISVTPVGTIGELSSLNAVQSA